MNDVLLKLADPALGWLLALPRDVALVLVALVTALLLRGIRKLTTDQDLLQRCAADRVVLAQRRKAARRRDERGVAQLGAEAVRGAARTAGVALDAAAESRVRALVTRAARRDELRRINEIQGRIARKALRQEAWPLLVSLLPLALLATWAWNRLAFHPPAAGEAVEITLRCPVTDVGRLAHLVPSPSLSASGGWIREVAPASAGGRPCGEARWTVRGAAQPQPHALVVRCGERTLEHELLIGQQTYAPPQHTDDAGGGYALDVALRPYKFLGVLPGIAAFGLPPWVVVYLAVVLACLPLLKRWLKVY